MEFSAGLMPLETALTQMLSRITPLTAVETLPLVNCFGRILATDIVSPLDVPGFDNSAMDGYAVRMADLSADKPLPVAGKAFAGQPYQGEWPAGTCIRIMTGAPVPTGCEAVVMQEQTEQTDDGVRFTADVRCGQNIRRRGEDIRQDAVVFPAGTRLTTAELPVLASLGIADAQVVRKVRVALFSTGDELQLPGQPLEAGQIYDTNRLTIHLMLQQLGCEVINLGIIPDDPGKLRAAFVDADSQADVVISSGGVSVGEADYTKTILEELGEIAFWKLAIKPGKPFAFGKLSNSWFCGLPGNPVSAALTFLSTGSALTGEAWRQHGKRSAAAPACTHSISPEENAGGVSISSAAFCNVAPTANWRSRPPDTRVHIFSARLVWATALLCWSVNAAMLSRENGWKSSRLMLCSEACNGGT